jgi:mannose-6-phosphate isomerase-like protein (cupin superfamily)
VTVRQSAADTEGALLEVDAEWAAVSHEPPVHVHPAQDERFEISEGELSVHMDGETHVLRAGDSLEVPRGTVHKMWNSGEVTTRASWQVRPALRTEDFFASVHRLRESGRHGDGGMLTPLGAGVVMRAYPDEFRLPLPAPVHRAATGLLAALARLRGYPSLG